MIRTWNCPGFEPVQAHTKGEARALFVAQARKLEDLRFAPTRITRLPAGAVVTAGTVVTAAEAKIDGKPVRR